MLSSALSLPPHTVYTQSSHWCHYTIPRDMTNMSIVPFCCCKTRHCMRHNGVDRWRRCTNRCRILCTCKTRQDHMFIHVAHHIHLPASYDRIQRHIDAYISVYSHMHPPTHPYKTIVPSYPDTVPHHNSYTQLVQSLLYMCQQHIHDNSSVVPQPAMCRHHIGSMCYSCGVNFDADETHTKCVCAAGYYFMFESDNSTGAQGQQCVSGSIQHVHSVCTSTVRAWR